MREERAARRWVHCRKSDTCHLPPLARRLRSLSSIVPHSHETYTLVSRIEKWVAQRGNSNSGRFILHELRKTAVTEMLMLVHAMADSRPAPRVWAGMINLQSETLVEAGTEGLAREPACVADISKFPHARTLASMPNEYQAQISVFHFIEFSMLWLTSPPFSL